MDTRSNVTLANAVDIGVGIFASHGRLAAESFLISQQVPHHVVLRVLATAAFRRKPVTAPRWLSGGQAQR